MKRVNKIMAALVFGVFSGTANAHGTTPLKVEESIVINAPPVAVWRQVGNFGKPEKWMSMVAHSKAKGDNIVGATRKLILKNGAVIKEELKSYDAGKISYKYKTAQVSPITALPVNGVLNASLTVEPDAVGAKVILSSGRFYRSWQRQDDPPPDESEKAAESAMRALFVESLANLKAVVETYK